MKDYGDVRLALEVLKKTITSNELSIGFNKDTEELIFFETARYLADGKFKGFQVKLKDLVK